jgi:hypothetical protein
MPILIMALLALIMFGLVGIMLSVAVMMEHSTPDVHAARHDATHAETSADPPYNGPKTDKVSGESAPIENPPEEKKVHEHACAA